MDRRARLLPILLVGFAFLAGFFVGDRRAGVGSPSVPAPPTGATPTAVDSGALPALSAAPGDLRPQHSSRSGADAPPPGGPATVVVREGEEVVLEGLHPASFRVHVVDADGGAAQGAGVSAIPEGARDLAYDLQPYAETDATGRATMSVSAEGRYCLVVREGLLAAVRESVPATAEGRDEVEIVLGRMAPFEIRWAGFPAGASCVVSASAPGPTWADGTSAGVPLQANWSTTTTGEPLTISLPEGVAFTLGIVPVVRATGNAAGAPLRTVVTAPGSFLADFGARARAEVSPGTVNVDLRLTVEAESGALPPKGRVDSHFVDRVGDSTNETDGWLDWGPDDRTSEIPHSAQGWPAGTAGRIEWKVGGVAGSIAVPAARAGDELHLAATVRVPTSAIEKGVEAVEVLDERGASVPVGGPEETSADLFAPDEELGFTNEESAAGLLREWLWNKPGRPLVALRGPWRVSRPGKAVPGETLRLRLEKAGYLLLHLREPLSRGLGGLVVERVDGAWLGAYAGDPPLPNPTDAAGWSGSTARAVTNGTLLGPLPPGEVDFRFLLGGVEAGRATAHVKAGEVTVLTIR